MQKTKNSFARSPTLETVLMVERFIEKHSSKFNRTEVWKKLPKKIMWQTYIIIIDYLISINKIAIDCEGMVGHIWSQKAGMKFSKRKSVA